MEAEGRSVAEQNLSFSARLVGPGRDDGVSSCRDSKATSRPRPTTQAHRQSTSGEAIHRREHTPLCLRTYVRVGRWRRRRDDDRALFVKRLLRFALFVKRLSTVNTPLDAWPPEPTGQTPFQKVDQKEVPQGRSSDRSRLVTRVTGEVLGTEPAMTLRERFLETNQKSRFSQ